MSRGILIIFSYFAALCAPHSGEKQQKPNTRSGHTAFGNALNVSEPWCGARRDAVVAHRGERGQTAYTPSHFAMVLTEPSSLYLNSATQTLLWNKLPPGSSPV